MEDGRFGRRPMGAVLLCLPTTPVYVMLTTFFTLAVLVVGGCDTPLWLLPNDDTEALELRLLGRPLGLGSNDFLKSMSPFAVPRAGHPVSRALWGIRRASDRPSCLRPSLHRLGRRMDLLMKAGAQVRRYLQIGLLHAHVEYPPLQGQSWGWFGGVPY